MKFLPSVILLFMLNLNLTYTSSEDTNSTQAELKKDLEEIVTIKKRSKLVACMSIVRNSLAEGNSLIKDALDSSSFDRSKSFDKIVLTMLSNCEKSIKDPEMENALNPENILSPVSGENDLSRLIKFDKNLLSNTDSISFNKNESNILKEINDSSQSMDSDVTLQDEEIGFMGLKLSQMGKSGYLFIILALVLVGVIIFGGLYALKCKKKDGKVKKKKN